MRKVFLLMFLAPFSLFAQTSTGSFTFESLVRDYILFIPSGYNVAEPAPLVINMHGYTSNANEQMLYTAFNSDADTAGYIVVYPNGINNAWNSGFSFPYESGINDVGFLNALIDTISAHYNVDECRIHSTGMSNGGFMSYRLACELYDRIASIVSVTGSMTPGMTTHCNTNRAVAVMEIHGTADGTVPYTGGTGMTSVDANFAFWKNKNNCQGSSTSTNLPDVVTTDGATVTKIYQGGCDNSTEVITLKVNNGGHTWPDAIIDIGVTTKDINANSEIIQFFNKHPRCTSATAIDKVESAHKAISVYPNPASHSIAIETSMVGPYNISFFDITGKKVLGMDATDLKQIPIASLLPGMYTVQLHNGEENLYTEIIKQ